MSRCCLEGCSSLVRDRVLQLCADWVDIVIYAGRQKLEQQLVDALRVCVGVPMGALLTVSATAEDKPALHGVSGRLRGASDDQAAAAAQAFLLLAAFSAPKTISCAEHQDLPFFNGDAGVTSTILEATWLRPSRRLVFASDAHRDVVRNAEDVHAVLSSRSPGGELQAMAEALRHVMRPGATLHYQAPWDMIPTDRLHPSVTPVLIICWPPRATA